jgi:tetratricopeptide (TPR) repeat protein
MSRKHPRERAHRKTDKAGTRLGDEPPAISRDRKASAAAATNPRSALFRWLPWILLALVAINVIVYAPVRHYDFVSIDDPKYVYENRHVIGGLTWPAVAWAFTTGYASNWHPLTWLSHMLDVQMYGLNAGPQHVTSLILHIVNTLLLFVVLLRMTGGTGRSALVAALFAIHPLHVESVAWIAERKDVLSTFFWILTLWAYVEYVRKPRWDRYTSMLVFFALGLMAKPMLVTLPFLLLLLDVWPLGRTTFVAAATSRTKSSGLPRAWASLVREKAPLMALAAISSLVTFMVQRRGGAVGGLEAFPLAQRIANALVAYGAYIKKMIWPFGLAVFYPFPRSVAAGSAVVALIVLIGASVLVKRWARQCPYLLVGWLWYVGTLLPVIGLIQVGKQAMADRYTYVPLIGLFIIVAWGVPDLLARWHVGRRVLPAMAALVVLACAFEARAQLVSWKDSLNLWQHTLDVIPNNYFAHNALGALLARQGRIDEATAHFSTSVQLEPEFPDAHDNLGLMLLKKGKTAEAIAEYRYALQLNPQFAEAHNDLGAAFAVRGEVDEAIAQCAEALRLKPDLAAAHNNLGMALAAQGKIMEAIARYTEALRLQPGYPEAHANLGLALASQSRNSEAIAQYTEALRLEPNSADTHNYLGVALAAQGKVDEAVAQYTEALRLDPDHADAHNNLGVALAAQGKTTEAIRHFSAALRLKPDFEMAHFYLGLALAGTGEFDRAILEFSDVLRINPNNDKARRALAQLIKRNRS